MARLKSKRTSTSDGLTLRRKLILLGAYPSNPQLVRVDAPGNVITDRELERSVAEFDRREFGPDGAGGTWRKHRGELIAECDPGQRPTPFYQFDVGVNPPLFWWDELDLLRDRGLLSADECFRIERFRRELAPHDLPSPATRSFQLAHATVWDSRELVSRARWHAWRGRPELAAWYVQLAQRCAEVKAANLKARQPE